MLVSCTFSCGFGCDVLIKSSTGQAGEAWRHGGLCSIIEYLVDPPELKRTERWGRDETRRDEMEWNG